MRLWIKPNAEFAIAATAPLDELAVGTLYSASGAVAAIANSAFGLIHSRILNQTCTFQHSTNLHPI
ncbi:MAG: hypothetical protein AAGA83_23315 [Cyanobacteria bacterium P01_F01_bin.116]